MRGVPPPVRPSRSFLKRVHSGDLYLPGDVPMRWTPMSFARLGVGVSDKEVTLCYRELTISSR